MAEPSPVVARWELSRRLATRRKELGVDVKAITDALGFSRNYWSAVENDRTLIAEDKLRRLFDLLQFDSDNQTQLLELREDARKRGWWDEHSSLSEDNRRFLGLEAGAVRIRAYDGHLVPGILQIEEYTRAVIEADPVFSPVETDTLTRLRRVRQQQFWQNSRPEFTVLLSEAVLRQQVAGPEVQADQLRHLLEISSADGKRPTIQVVPFEINPGVIASSSTLLFMEYDSVHLPVVAWQEAVHSLGAIHEDEERFRQLDIAWMDGIRRALNPIDSRSMIDHIMNSLAR